MNLWDPAQQRTRNDVKVRLLSPNHSNKKRILIVAKDKVDNCNTDQMIKAQPSSVCQGGNKQRKNLSVKVYKLIKSIQET